jgi:tRNA(His) 5'-end guanylyltransferase
MQRIKGKTASWEVYSSVKVRPPFIIRADGRGFKKVLAGCKKPYDLDFARAISGSAAKLFEESGLSPLLAYTFSDEVSLLFTDSPFDGRVEKLDSVIASFLSGALSLSLGRVVSMDARAIPICLKEAQDYLSERQDEAWRNHVFSYGFYSLSCDGKSPAEAMEELRYLKESEIHEMLFQRGVNLAKSPSWERRGVLVYRKKGKVVQDWEIPLFSSEEGQRFLEEIIGSS